MNGFNKFSSTITNKDGKIPNLHWNQPIESEIERIEFRLQRAYDSLAKFNNDFLVKQEKSLIIKLKDYLSKLKKLKNNGVTTTSDAVRIIENHNANIKKYPF